MNGADYVTVLSGLLLVILVLAPPVVRLARLIRAK